jgi:hypothetical protein
LAVSAQAQTDSSLLKRIPTDTSQLKMNLDAVYNRPFLGIGKVPVALGGYMEVNTIYSGTDGINEGFSFQFKRLTLFTSSTIAKKIKFLSEIEFEDGTKEINIEFAAADFEFHPLLNLRGGIVMNPIGAFNQNHDGPKWEFIERPISATKMLPATWSNAGFGIHGKYYQANWVFGYEAYLTNGFDDRIVNNNEGKTFLPASKQNPDRFEESFSGEPMFTGKVALRRRKIGEIGFSYMGGVYNKFQLDGVLIDKKRTVNVYAIDLNSTLPNINTNLTGEFAWINVDLPNEYIQNFGRKQHGGFLDIVQPVLKRKMFGWEKSVLNVAFRTEYVDWNIGNFNSTGDNIFDHVFAIVPGISFRPTAQTVMRLNYRYEWQRDLLGNPAARTAAINRAICAKNTAVAFFWIHDFTAIRASVLQQTNFSRQNLSFFISTFRASDIGLQSLC